MLESRRQNTSPNARLMSCIWAKDTDCSNVDHYSCRSNASHRRWRHLLSCGSVSIDTVGEMPSGVWERQVHFLMIWNVQFSSPFNEVKEAGCWSEMPDRTHSSVIEFKCLRKFYNPLLQIKPDGNDWKILLRDEDEHQCVASFWQLLPLHQLVE